MTEIKNKVYFGGRYRECWNEDYKMSVEYSDRRMVEAERRDGSWIPAGGDSELSALLTSPDCPRLTQDYFQAAAEVRFAAADCINRGLPLDRMYESFHFSGNPLTASELMRLLLDDCGLPLNMAYFVCANCCDDIYGVGVDFSELYKIQPRTAHLLSILRRTATELTIAIHDARFPEYRKPFGAVRCGEQVTLRVRVVRERAQRAVLVLYGDNMREEYPMERMGEWFSAVFPAPETPKALWYSFRIENMRMHHHR